MFMVSHLNGFGVAAAAGGATDPNFASVGLLLHMDGADASTTFTDNSSSAKTVTAVGNAQIDTAQSKFGGASGLFDGTGDNLTLADSADWFMDTGNVTVEFWIRFNAVTGLYYAVSQYVDGNNFLAVIFNFTAAVGARFFILNGGAFDVDFSQGATTGWSTGTWYHVALVRNGHDWAIYRDGTSIASTTDASAWPNFAGTLYIGQLGDGTNYFNGWLDDLRITKGVARYTANFTPPTEAFPDA